MRDAAKLHAGCPGGPHSPHHIFNCAGYDHLAGHNRRDALLYILQSKVSQSVSWPAKVHQQLCKRCHTKAQVIWDVRELNLPCQSFVGVAQAPILDGHGPSDWQVDGEGRQDVLLLGGQGG